MSCLRKFLSIFLGLSIFLFLLFSQADAQTGRLFEEAKKEGEVVWYATVNIQTCQAVARGFEQRYPGVKVRLLRANSQQQLTRMVSEFNSKKYQADVIEINVQMISVLKAGGMLGKYASPESHSLPSGFKDPDDYWASNYFIAYCTAYNTRLVPPGQVPKTLEDLLNPRWRGKIMVDVTKPQWFITHLERMGKEKGMAYFEALGNQKLISQRGLSLLAQLLAAGEASLGLFTSTASVEILRKAGAPVNIAPISPIICSVDSIGITSHPPHPYAARLLVDFVLSEEGQRLIGENSNIPARPNVSHPFASALEKTSLYPTKPVPPEEYNRLFNLYRSTLHLKS